jgi:hypothetical protein
VIEDDMMDAIPSATNATTSDPTTANVLPYRRANLGDRPDDCYRCGYPLLGIDDEQPCPGCGLLARRSRRQTDELHNTRPRWLKRISRGANLILLAIVISAAWPFVTTWIMRRMSWLRIGGMGWDSLPLLGFDIASVAFVAGAWLLCSAEKYPPADRADRRLRWALRVFAVTPILVVLLGHVIGYYYRVPVRWVRIGGLRVTPISTVQRVFWAALMVGCTPLPLLLFARLKGLAKRARSAHLAEHCMIVGVGTTASLVLFGTFAWISNNASRWGWGSYWTSRSQIALGMTVALAVAAILFTLWSLYLFIRFTDAFRRAALQLRGKWHDDDRAITPGSAAAPPA